MTPKKILSASPAPAHIIVYDCDEPARGVGGKIKKRQEKRQIGPHTRGKKGPDENRHNSPKQKGIKQRDKTAQKEAKPTTNKKEPLRPIKEKAYHLVT